MPGQRRDERTLHADGSSSSETGSPSVPVARAASMPSGAASVDGSAARASARSKNSMWAYLPSVSVPKPNFSLVGYTT